MIAGNIKKSKVKEILPWVSVLFLLISSLAALFFSVAAYIFATTFFPGWTFKVMLREDYSNDIKTLIEKSIFDILTEEEICALKQTADFYRGCTFVYFKDGAESGIVEEEAKQLLIDLLLKGCKTHDEFFSASLVGESLDKHDAPSIMIKGKGEYVIAMFLVKFKDGAFIIDFSSKDGVIGKISPRLKFPNYMGHIDASEGRRIYEIFQGNL